MPRLSPFAPATLPASQSAETFSVSAAGNAGLLNFFASSLVAIAARARCSRSVAVTFISPAKARPRAKMPECAVHEKVVRVRRLGDGKDFVPFAEADER